MVDIVKKIYKFKLEDNGMFNIRKFRKILKKANKIGGTIEIPKRAEHLAMIESQNYLNMYFFDSSVIKCNFTLRFI